MSLDVMDSNGYSFRIASKSSRRICSAVEIPRVSLGTWEPPSSVLNSVRIFLTSSAHLLPSSTNTSDSPHRHLISRRMLVPVLVTVIIGIIISSSTMIVNKSKFKRREEMLSASWKRRNVYVEIGHSWIAIDWKNKDRRRQLRSNQSMSLYSSKIG